MMINMWDNSGVSMVMLVVLLAAWMPSPGNALKCHVCTSLENDDCDTIVDNRHVKDCMQINKNPTKNHTICRSEVFSVASVKFKISTQRTIRSCGYTKHPKFSCFFNSNHDLKETICECDDDGCNEAASLYFSIKTLLCTVLSLYMALYVIR